MTAITLTNKRIPLFIFIALSYTVLAVAFTYPLVLHLDTRIPDFAGDAFQFIWGMWHLNASASFANPFSTNSLYFPLHINLFLHAWTPLKCFLSLPLLRVLTPVAAYNVIFLITFVANALGIYYLIDSMIRNKSVAFISGMIFAFAPFKMAHGFGGHFNLMSTEAIPWALLVWRNNWNRPHLLKQLAMSLLGVYLFFSDYQLFIYMGGTALLYLLFEIGRNPTNARKVSLVMVGVGIMFGVALIPFWIMAVKNIGEYNIMALHTQGWGGADIYSLDALALLIPSELHPWWGGFSKGLFTKLHMAGGNVAERTAFLGYFVTAIVVFGSVKFWRRASVRFWVLVSLVFTTLAFGPILWVGGKSLNAIAGLNFFSLDGIQVLFPMPYTLIHYLPVVNGARVPSRFYIIAILAATIVFAYTAEHLLGKLKSSEWGARALVSLAFLIVFIEYLSMPYPLASVEAPSVYNQIRKDSLMGFSVLDLPTAPWVYDLHPMYYQTVHGKPIVGGLTARNSRRQEEYITKNEVVKRMSEADPCVNPQEVEPIISTLRIKYIVSRSKKTQEMLARLKRLGLNIEQIVDDSLGGAVLWKCSTVN